VGVPTGGKAGQVLKKNSDKDFDTEWQDDIAGQSGTKVTIGGEEVEEFPADVYVGDLVRKLHAELVNNAPEALDTLYELAKALGDDPNFATTIMTMLGGKLDKINGKYVVYGVGGSGEQRAFQASYKPTGADLIPLSGAKGEIRGGRAVNEDGFVPLGQLNEILDTRLGSLDTALDEILALQEYYTGATFDELHEYATNIVNGGGE
jgi:hypothetical protein